MKKLITLFVVFAGLTAHAALPPTAESLRRIRAVAESQEVYDALGSAQWVSSIQDNNNGTYTVTTNQCKVDVKVEAVTTHPPRMVPPLKISVVQTVCLPGV